MNPLSVLRDALYFFRRHLWTIARLCLPLVVLESLGKQWVAHATGPEGAPLYDIFIGLLFYPLYTAVLILFLDARSNERHVAGRELLAMALRLWPAFALLAAISTLVIMFGMSLFLLPGLWVMVKLVFAEYFLVLRNRTPLGAIQDSFQLTNGYFWQILGCVLAVMVPLWLLDGLSSMVWSDTPAPWLMLVIDSANGFLQLFTSVVVFRLFMLIEGPRLPRDAQ